MGSEMRTLAHRLVRRMQETSPSQPFPLRLRQGTVASVNENGTIHVTVTGTGGMVGTIRNMRCYGGPPTEGTRIWFFQMGRGRFLAFFPSGGTSAPPGDTTDFYNVFEYGAVGNGVVNDTPAIQAAVDAATAAGGGTVLLPAATYKQIGAGVVLTRSTDGRLPVRIVGEGTATILQTDDAISMIRIQNTGLAAYQTTMCVVEGVKFNMDDDLAVALDLDQCSYGHFDDLEFAGVGTGIRIDGGSAAIANQFTRIRCVFPGRAVHIIDGAYNIITNLIVLEGISGDRAVYVQGGAGNIISDFVIRANKLGNPVVPAPVAAVHIGAAEGTVLANGQIFDAAADGLLVDGSPNFTNVSNVFIKNSQKYGARINGNRGKYDLNIFSASLDGAGLFDGLRVQNTATGNLISATVEGSNHAADVKEVNAPVKNTYTLARADNVVMVSATAVVLGAGLGTRIKDVKDLSGAGTPEGAITAPVGSTYRRTDGGAGTSFYVKETGTGNTGWVAK